MYCCLCDLQQRHHPTPSCDGCTCFYMGDVVPNPMVPLKKFAEQMRKSMDKFGKELKKGTYQSPEPNIHRGIDYKGDKDEV